MLGLILNGQVCGLHLSQRGWKEKFKESQVKNEGSQPVICQQHPADEIFISSTARNLLTEYVICRTRSQSKACVILPRVRLVDKCLEKRSYVLPWLLS